MEERDLPGWGGGLCYSRRRSPSQAGGASQGKQQTPGMSGEKIDAVNTLKVLPVQRLAEPQCQKTLLF